MFAIIRVLLAIFGGGLFIIGLLLVVGGGPAAAAGIWPIISGGVVLIAVVLERQRYRSQATEQTVATFGPGGGEPGALPSNFTATDERFIDPTTSIAMRVWIDARTGERRYRAEADPKHA